VGCERTKIRWTDKTTETQDRKKTDDKSESKPMGVKNRHVSRTVKKRIENADINKKTKKKTMKKGKRGFHERTIKEQKTNRGKKAMRGPSP